MQFHCGMPIDAVTIPNDIFFAHAKTLIDEGHSLTITVVGNSMQPFFESLRDEVKLEKCKRAKVGDMILALTDDRRYVAHRVIAVSGERITMRGDGNVYGIEHAVQYDVVGIVTHYRRKGESGFHDMYSWKWRLYSLLWPRNVLVRRLFLAFHHYVWLRLLWLAKKPEWINLDKNNKK